ncbi:MAG: class I SAM-dependent methyltransferase [Promethearchaeota archaeon]
MLKDILKELNADEMRKVFLKYTRMAFEMLPKMENPQILDIGCGSGIPTLELAKLSDGEIIGLDIDQSALNKFNVKIEKKGLSNRIKTFNRSVYNTKFPNGRFDLIWEEGVIHILNIKKALKECNRILKKKGFLVSFETIKWVKNNLEIFPKLGFKLLDKFLLPEKAWWTEFYSPLENKINELRIKYKGSKELMELEGYEKDIVMLKKNPKEFDCGFYIYQKI